MSHAVLHWLTESRVETVIIDLGKQWQNGTNESLTGKFRDECLGAEWFRTRCDAPVIIETWRPHYNTPPTIPVSENWPHTTSNRTIRPFTTSQPGHFPRTNGSTQRRQVIRTCLHAGTSSALLLEAVVPHQ